MPFRIRPYPASVPPDVPTPSDPGPADPVTPPAGQTPFEAMLAAGWIAETRALLERHDPAGPGLSSIGYREIVRHLAGDLPPEALVPAIVRVTRQYAKRQRTWFRPLPRLAAGSPDDPSFREAVAAAIEDAMADR